MVVKILRWLAVLPASALAYCLGWVIALAIRNQIFYDEMFGLFMEEAVEVLLNLSGLSLLTLRHQPVLSWLPLRLLRATSFSWCA